jgi:hypothetical protein
MFYNLIAEQIEIVECLKLATTLIVGALFTLERIFFPAIVGEVCNYFKFSVVFFLFCYS